ncbi:hypothetical protein V5799_025952 [Amblyomma americanum]|uniref:Uncharacterized protein n=1 Tax=Amblyomma americanum TaxID=6943 RepID=A0AAQ4DJY4_AMBAM
MLQEAPLHQRTNVFRSGAQLDEHEPAATAPPLCQTCTHHISDTSEARPNKRASNAIDLHERLAALHRLSELLVLNGIELTRFHCTCISLPSTPGAVDSNGTFDTRGYAHAKWRKFLF